jgi:excisionase family DNA binding protein
MHRGAFCVRVLLMNSTTESKIFSLFTYHIYGGLESVNFRREPVSGRTRNRTGGVCRTLRRLPGSRMSKQQAHKPGHEDFLDVSDIALRWHLSRETVRRRIRAGELEAIQIGRHFLVRRETVEALESKRVVK